VQRNEAEPSREDVGWADWFEETFGSPGEAGLPEAVDASSNPLPETVVERKTAEDSTTAREHVDLKKESGVLAKRRRNASKDAIAIKNIPEKRRLENCDGHFVQLNKVLCELDGDGVLTSQKMNKDSTLVLMKESIDRLRREGIFLSNSVAELSNECKKQKERTDALEIERDKLLQEKTELMRERLSLETEMLRIIKTNTRCNSDQLQ